MAYFDKESAGSPGMELRRARWFGLLAIAVVAGLQAFNSVACYQHDLGTYLKTLGFIAIPMLPAFVGLLTSNPLRAVGASAFFAPWLMLAYYTDCVRPYIGGGASMIYVAVVLWGLPTAAVGAILSGTLFNWLGVRVRQS